MATQPTNNILDTLFDQTADMRVITDAISLIDPDDTPILDWLGFDSANRKFDIVNGPGYQTTWLMDQYRDLTGTLGATLATDTTGITVSGTVLAVGDVIEFKDAAERAWVSAVDSTGTAATVTRAFLGTTVSAQTATTVTIVGQAALQNRANWTYYPIEALTSGTNYLQIFDEAVKVGDLDRVIKRYGKDDELAYQADKKIPQMSRLLEKAILTNKSSYVGTATAAPYMGGFPSFITTNTLSTAASLFTLTQLKNMILSCYLAGGKPDTLVCSPLRLQTLTDLYENSNYLRIVRSEDTLGMAIGRVETPWGTMNFKASRHCPNTHVFLLDSSLIGTIEVMPWHTKPVPPTGPWEGRAVQGVFSLAVLHENAHAYITLT